MASAKENKLKISYPALLKKITQEKNFSNIMLFTSEKIVLENVLSLVCDEFLGKSYDPKTSLSRYYSDEVPVDTLLSEAGNLGFFAEKKVMLYKIVKRAGVRGISKNDRELLLKYLAQPNPDTLLLVNITDKDYNFVNFDDFLSNKNIQLYIIPDPAEADLVQWVKDYMTGYKIDDDAIGHLLKFVNSSYDEISQEMEKLKTFTYTEKVITPATINLCIGLSKDFSESDFIESLLKRNPARAISIYENLTQRGDAVGTHLLLLGMINYHLVNIFKMLDPSVLKMNYWEQIKELKIFYEGEKFISLYKDYLKGMNDIKIKNAFDYIYKIDKSMKSTDIDPKSLFSGLIYYLTKL